MYLLLIWLTAFAPMTIYAPYTRPTNIAHRGASGEAPEHTLIAYQAALRHGADFVEPDLQMTKDGVLVCMHDTSLERTTNVAMVFPERSREVKGKRTWPVADFTLEEIQRLDAGGWKDARFAGAKVPTFQEMIELVRGKAGIIPETKAPDVYGDLGMSMERAVMEVLKKNGLDRPGAVPETPVVIQSFSAESLRLLREKHGCQLPLVYLFTSKEPASIDLDSIKSFADGIAPDKATVLRHPSLVQAAHERRMSVTVWTFRVGQTGDFANVREEMRYFLGDLHVDAVFTDDPNQFPRDVR